jgi:O-antigen/teichoic acid export membrane protein
MTRVDRHLSRSTGLLLVSNVGSAGFAFLISVVIGRLLGERGLGVYSASLAWVYPVSILADAGINTLLSLQARWLIAGGLTATLFTLAPLLSTDAAVISGIQLSAPLVFVLPTFGLYTAIFRARQKMWPIPILNLGMLIAQAALTSFVLAQGGTVVDAFIINTLTSTMQVPVAWWLYRQHFSFHHTSTEFNEESQSTDEACLVRTHPIDDVKPVPGSWKLIALLRQAYPFAIAGILATLQARLAYLMLERGANLEAVGQFAAAARITEAGRMLPNALFGALLPALSIWVAQSESYERLIRRVYTGIIAYGLALAALIALAASPILQLTYGEAFLRGTLALQISGLALVPGLIRAVQTLAAYAHGEEARVNRVIAIGILVQVVVALWLTPAQGAAGAAASLLVSEVLMVILLRR